MYSFSTARLSLTISNRSMPKPYNSSNITQIRSSNEALEDKPPPGILPLMATSKPDSSL